MLEPRYRIRAKYADSHIESHPAKTRGEADAKFSELVRDAPADRLYVQLEDSGRERGDFNVIKSCDLTQPVGIEFKKVTENNA